MRPAVRRTAFAAACFVVFVLAGCGKHVASNAPITYAPADTPYLLANFKPIPQDVVQAWNTNPATQLSVQLQTLARLATREGHPDPELTAVLNALGTELENVHSRKELAQATGFSQSALMAVYGIGDIPVARIELASPDTFKAFWARVEKRAGIATPTATLDKQTYWVIGGTDAKVHFLVAIEGSQLVATVAPANTGAEVLKQLLGLTKPATNASARLAGINSRHGYSDYGSGYIDLPKLFANLFDGKDQVTREFARNLGGSLANPACASEFASLAEQVPLASAGYQTVSAAEMHGSVDVQLSAPLLGVLTALKQPVAGMDETNDDSMFDLVLAAPVAKWQAFMRDRAKAAAGKTYQCPALQSLNHFANTAANPPIQLPPEAASLLGVRVVLDKWEAGPQIAARALVESSHPAELVQRIQQTLPQFALKTIPVDGKPVAFDLPPRVQAMLGGGSQGWIAANANTVAMGVGEGEDTKLAGTLTAPAGNGDRLLRLHFDGKMYGLLGSWMARFAAMAPGARQAQLQQTVATFNRLGKVVKSTDLTVHLDDTGLHFETELKHR